MGSLGNWEDLPLWVQCHVSMTGGRVGCAGCFDPPLTDPLSSILDGIHTCMCLLLTRPSAIPDLKVHKFLIY